jgi:hypothetical protein
MFQCGAVAALALLASPAPAAQPQEPSGMVVVRDPQTGRMRAPTPAELRALQAAPGQSPTLGPQQAKPVVRPDGTRALTLDERSMVYSVATRDASGKVVEQCVDAAGVDKHVHGDAPACGLGSGPAPGPGPAPDSSAPGGKENHHEQ